MMEDSNTWPLAHQVCTNQWWSVSNERHLLKIDTCGDMTRVKSFPATRDGIDGSQIAQNLWMIFCGQGSWDPALIMPQKGFMDLRINFGQLYQLLYSTSHKQKIPEKWEIYKYDDFMGCYMILCWFYWTNISNGKHMVISWCFIWFYGDLMGAHGDCLFWKRWWFNEKHMVIYYDVIVFVWWFHGDVLEKMLLIGKYICYCDLVGKHVI